MFFKLLNAAFDWVRILTTFGSRHLQVACWETWSSIAAIPNMQCIFACILCMVVVFHSMGSNSLGEPFRYSPSWRLQFFTNGFQLPRLFKLLAQESWANENPRPTERCRIRWTAVSAYYAVHNREVLGSNMLVANKKISFPLLIKRKSISRLSKLNRF